MEDRSVQQMQAAGARLLQSSPAFAEKMGGAGRHGSRGNLGLGSGGPPGGKNDDRDAVITEMKKQLDSEKEKNRSLEDDYKSRVTSFVTRETQTRNKIDALERRLNDGPEADDHEVAMNTIDDLHKNCIAGLQCIQHNTSKIRQEQQKDLMRACRSRLEEVAREHEAQKSRRGEPTALQAKHRKVVAELHEAQELQQFYDRKNRELAEENKKLQDKLRSREEDSKGSVKELVLAKKELARLKAQFKEGFGNAFSSESVESGHAEESTTPVNRRKSMMARQIKQAQLQQSRNKQYEREVSYREAITKLKRMVEVERKTARALQTQFSDSAEHRTELEVLLHQCLDDVKAEVQRHRAESTQASGEASDHERVLELLLSQQRVVELLYSKTFSNYHPPSPLTRDDDAAYVGPPTSGDTRDDEFAWLGEIIPPEGGS